ncbi:MAG TPA: hypothetical protein VEG60_14435 [Candidatus Binatia bacterium]|nr:hypothetical protein [Candidatus Binatia bacterium]
MIAARRTIDHLRRSKTPANSLEKPLLSGATDDSGDERVLIDLFFRQNLSAQDVASILHISAGAVYTQKSRILAKLRKAFEKLNPP